MYEILAYLYATYIILGLLFQAFVNAGEKLNDFKIEKALEMCPGDGDGNPYIFEFAKIYFNFILKIRFKYSEKFKRKKLEITLTDPSQ